MNTPIPRGQVFTIDLPGHDNFAVHYHDIGEGPAVLFLHGSGPGASGWSNFHGTAETWSKAGYRCLLPDIPGYGLSDMPADFVYSFEALSTAMLGLLDHLGIQQLVLVGNSMGGALAIKLTLDHPQRVSKLILMAPGGLETPETYMSMSGIRSMLRSIFGPEGITADGMRRVFRKQLFDPELVTEELVQTRTAIAEAQPQSIWKTMRVPNQADRLGEIKCSVLCMWGENDLFCPVSGASTVQNACSQARVITLPECGHWVMVEKKPEFDEECLRFLNNG